MSMFNILLYSSLSVCIAGLVYRIAGWFVSTVGINGIHSSPFRRIAAASRALFRGLFSLNILKLFRTLLLDVVFQRRILVKAGFFRWAAHVLIVYGFLFLLFMHALDDIVTQRLFSDYYSTLNPFLFLRGFFGLLVVVGVAIAIGRRFLSKQRVNTTLMDAYAVFIVAFIILSGVFLEGLTMTSYSEFERMLEDYAGLYDEEEISALESFWVENFALVSPTITDSADPDLLALGEEVNDTYCMSCHVSNKWGFMGYGIARVIQPVAGWLDQVGGVPLFWYVHIIACFFALAILPFTKMFHMVSVPVSMIVGALRNEGETAPEQLATINAMEIDACTHCGICTQSCSAAMMFAVMGNEYILPSEKMRALKKLTGRRKTNQNKRDAVLQGIYVCTSCERCTVACPSGIRLKDLWVNAREGLIQSGVAESAVLSPFSFVRGIQRETYLDIYINPVNTALKTICGNGYPAAKACGPLVLAGENRFDIRKRINAGSFSACFDCRNCTAICPVVASYEKPEKTLGMLPHQIMCSLGLNQIEPASKSAMIWYCLTCYQCQEHCPQNVAVCDCLYSLKNYAVNQLEDA